MPPQQHSASGWAQQKAAGDPQYLPARAPGCWVTRATGMTSQGMQGNSARGVRDAIAVARETAGDILQVSWVLGWGQSSPASPAAQQGLGGLWDMPWGLALSLPSPWGTGEEMRIFLLGILPPPPGAGGAGTERPLLPAPPLLGLHKTTPRDTLPCLPDGAHPMEENLYTPVPPSAQSQPLLSPPQRLRNTTNTSRFFSQCPKPYHHHPRQGVPPPLSTV